MSELTVADFSGASRGQWPTQWPRPFFVPFFRLVIRPRNRLRNDTSSDFSYTLRRSEPMVGAPAEQQHVRNERKDLDMRSEFGSAGASRRLAVVTLLFVAHGVTAGTVFKCVDAHGTIAFQTLPCAGHTMQTELTLREQPLIDPDASSDAAEVSRRPLDKHARKRSGGRVVSRRSHKDEEPVSYECRAADGEVFYRHSKCPASVPGDGIARFGVDQPTTGHRRGHSRSHGGAWGKVSVKAVKISRDEACRAINATAASGRDGHLRDEQVSVYEHNLGHDPCSGY
jgi:hypothetical protein